MGEGGVSGLRLLGGGKGEGGREDGGKGEGSVIGDWDRESGYLSHWLTELGACDSGEVGVDGCGEDDDDDEAEEPAGADGHEDAEGLAF